MEKLDVMKLWDYLHSIPELGFKEFKTAAFLAKELEKLGYKVTRNVGGTGVIGELSGTEEGPTIMLRADMDALPFVIDGKDEVIHACGHDAHCAMVLAAAAILADKIKRGKLLILFQPGEETLKGALAVIATGLMDKVDIAMGLHIRPIQDIPNGTMTPAICHGASTFAQVKILGKGCHGSRPHLGVNACDAVAAVINAVNAIKLNPVLAWSCKVTNIKAGGAAPNIIPDKAALVLDCRAQTNEVMTEMLAKLKMAITNAAASVGATATLDTPDGVIPAANLDPELTAEVAECIKEVVGENNLQPNLLNPGGDDFHYYAQHNPKLKAVFFGVGCAAEPGLHDSSMHFNHDMMPLGTEVLVKMLVKKLG